MKEKYLLDTTLFSTVSLSDCAASLWQTILPKIKYLSAEELRDVENAFNWMVISHDQQRRKNGEFYITHPVAAMSILAELGLDKDTLSAALLHDVPEDTDTTLKDLSQDFEPSVIFLIEAVTKLSSIKYKGEDRYAENLRRMFVAMSQDLRVVFIKMADRLHNLYTLGALPEEKKRRIATESLEIYAPLAERLGIAFFRGEIEDQCFKHLYPNEHTEILTEMNRKIDSSAEIVKSVSSKLQSLLMLNNIDFVTVSGRAKKYYSTWKKMISKDYSLDKIDDLIAIRIIVKNVEQCYQALSLVHKNFEPKEGRMKDYIRIPKPNGYQSLHTTVIDPTSKESFEIQIRTEEMHSFAEYGVASHWIYKSKGKSNDQSKLMSNESLKWLGDLVDLGNLKWSQDDYLKHVKLDIFNNRIFVFTPKQDAIDLPIGATPLDFAFRIHYDIGCHASMAKINGKAAKLGDELNNGDTVEILTDKKQSPKRDWIKLVKTTNATKHIRSFLRKAGEVF
jgi:GTP diphosphokinase / guanosine-3',5'-bis(diphosphate) 3'-diphosphatase